MKIFFVIAAVLLEATVFGSRTLLAQTAYTQVVTNDNPSLYWNFDEASGNAREVVPVVLPPTINDLIPVANATRVSHASLSDGLNLGNAASFQVGDYFITPGMVLSTNLLTGPWLLEFWMQVQGDLEFQRNNYLMNFGNGGGNSPAVLYDYVGAVEPRDELELFGSGRSGAGPLISDENWHHVIFAYYGNGTNGVADRLDVYVDGTNAAQNIRSTFMAPMSLTRFVAGTSAPQYAGSDGFEGNLDEIAVYDLSHTATNESQMTSKVSIIASNHFNLAHSGQSYAQGVLTDGPILYWNFDEESGNASQLAPVVFPIVHNDLTPNGGAGRVAHAAINSGLALGNAAHFPVGGYFNIGQITFPTNAMTPPFLLEFWIQVEGSQTNQRNDYIMNFDRNAPGLLYDYVNGAQPRDGLELFGGGGRTGPGPVIADENWHHIVMADYGDGIVGVADRLDMYEDGTNVAQNIRATFDGPLTLTSLVIGSSGAQFAAQDGFEGNLDEVALYSLTNLTTEADVTTKAADISARHFAAAQQQQPTLSIAAAGNVLTLSWTTSATNNFTLEATPGLATPQWTAVNVTPTVTNGVSTVNVNQTGQAQFYRLRK